MVCSSWNFGQVLLLNAWFSRQLVEWKSAEQSCSTSPPFPHLTQTAAGFFTCPCRGHNVGTYSSTSGAYGLTSRFRDSARITVGDFGLSSLKQRCHSGFCPHPTHLNASRNVVIAPSFLARTFDFISTLRSPLLSLVTSGVSGLVAWIDLNSLWILKGDLWAAFVDPFDLIF
ncbi:hypothetical protein PoB_006035800 [Plakobranchus ocellatus]|uniref:Uncharacterized protein n=1 Tax=Plakobranchus ocellatus TaxID=259542 RepID=A0AAV4CPM9_9GAST|nr:hypothetical protein PoB_006035800 [Plakobranchus ocellatus]